MTACTCVITEMHGKSRFGTSSRSKGRCAQQAHPCFSEEEGELDLDVANAAHVAAGPPANAVSAQAIDRMLNEAGGRAGERRSAAAGSAGPAKRGAGAGRKRRKVALAYHACGRAPQPQGNGDRSAVSADRGGGAAHGDLCAEVAAAHAGVYLEVFGGTLNPRGRTHLGFMCYECSKQVALVAWLQGAVL